MKTPKLAAAIAALSLLLIGGYVLLTGPHGRLVALLQKKDSGGFVHTVTIRQFAGRFKTELSEEGANGKALPVSAYEFYEGSYPITNAIIKWDDLHKFTVSFDNGATLKCSWDNGNCQWATQ